MEIIEISKFDRVKEADSEKHIRSLKVLFNQSKIVKKFIDNKNKTIKKNRKWYIYDRW